MRIFPDGRQEGMSQLRKKRVQKAQVVRCFAQKSLPDERRYCGNSTDPRYRFIAQIFKQQANADTESYLNPILTSQWRKCVLDTYHIHVEGVQCPAFSMFSTFDQPCVATRNPEAWFWVPSTRLASAFQPSVNVCISKRAHSTQYRNSRGM